MEGQRNRKGKRRSQGTGRGGRRQLRLGDRKGKGGDRDQLSWVSSE